MPSEQALRVDGVVSYVAQPARPERPPMVLEGEARGKRWARDAPGQSSGCAGACVRMGTVRIHPAFLGLAALASTACAQPADTTPKPSVPSATSAPATKPVAPAPALAAPTAVGANVLKNPGFEDGRDPWTTMAGQ